MTIIMDTIDELKERVQRIEEQKERMYSKLEVIKILREYLKESGLITAEWDKNLGQWMPNWEGHSLMDMKHWIEDKYPQRV